MAKEAKPRSEHRQRWERWLRISLSCWKKPSEPPSCGVSTRKCTCQLGHLELDFLSLTTENLSPLPVRAFIPPSPIAMCGWCFSQASFQPHFFLYWILSSLPIFFHCWGLGREHKWRVLACGLAHFSSHAMTARHVGPCSVCNSPLPVNHTLWPSFIWMHPLVLGQPQAGRPGEELWCVGSGLRAFGLAVPASPRPGTWSKCEARGSLALGHPQAPHATTRETTKWRPP